MTYLLDQVKPRFLIDGRKLQFREPDGKAVGARDPLVDFVCPIHQRTAAFDDLFCQNFGSLLDWRRLDLRALKNEIPKNQVASRLNPPHGWIEEDQIGFTKIVWEEFPEPFLANACDLGEQHDKLIVAPLNFPDLACDEKRAFLHHAFSRKYAVSPMDQIASERSRIDASSEVIRKTDEHAFAERFGIKFVGAPCFGESFGSRDFNELFKETRDLLRDRVTDAEPAGFVGPMFLRIEPRSNQNQEIRFCFSP